MIIGENISKDYMNGTERIPVLQDVNFTLGESDFIFLTGHSGAGKTTLIRMLTLEETPTSGKLMFDSIDITKLRKDLVPLYRRNLGVVFQDYKLMEYKTVYENISFVLEILNKPRKEIHETTLQLIEFMGLTNRAHLFPRQLSGGEKRRVTLARAIANKPKILIADEPTGDLDPENTKIIMTLLQKIYSAGTGIMMTTHNMKIIHEYKYPRWHLENGTLNKSGKGYTYAKEKKIVTPFKIKLIQKLPPEMARKIEKLNINSKEEFLALTEHELRTRLKLSQDQIIKLAQVIQSLC